MEIRGPFFIKYLIALRFVTKSTVNLDACAIRLPPHRLCAQGRDGFISRFLALFNRGERQSFPTIKSLKHIKSSVIGKGGYMNILLDAEVANKFTLKTNVTKHYPFCFE